MAMRITPIGRSRTSGSSVEFSDYRTYAPGDDYRRIDWNAYARLERVLAAHGEPRRESDTPEEHLARVLGRLDVDRRATRRLVDLFVRAEFSPHVVDAAMKDEAIDALVRVRDELRESAGLAEPAEVPA